MNNENVKIIEENGDFYVKFKTYHLFGLIKLWWYVLTPTAMGLMYRKFSTREEAQDYIDNSLDRYIGVFKDKF